MTIYDGENETVERGVSDYPSAPLRENQEFETDATPGHRLTASFAFELFLETESSYVIIAFGLFEIKR